MRARRTAPAMAAMGEGEKVVRAFFEDMWNAHDLAALDRFVSREVRYHPPRGATKGFDGYRAMIRDFLAGVPDLRFTIDAAVEREGLVATRIRITGTHAGTWRGHPPTARTLDVQGRPWLRVADGRVVEVWSLFDEAAAAEQLGLARL